MKSVKRKCSRCGKASLREKKRPATRAIPLVSVRWFKSTPEVAPDTKAAGQALPIRSRVGSSSRPPLKREQRGRGVLVKESIDFVSRKRTARLDPPDKEFDQRTREIVNRRLQFVRRQQRGQVLANQPSNELQHPPLRHLAGAFADQRPEHALVLFNVREQAAGETEK